MREILFRGKRVDNGEWVYGSLIRMEDEGYQTFIFPPYNYASSQTCGQLVAYGMIAVIPETVGQYTGFTDKNRRRIFEGDVVKGRYSLGFESPRVVGVVEYVAAEFVVKGVKQYSWLQKQLNCNFEVIGNKDDNPEMMEVRP